MRFWDSSAIIALLVPEPSAAAAREAYERDPEVVSWWGTEVECASALARLEREHDWPPASIREAFRRLEELSAAWQEVEPGRRLRQTAIRMLRVHPLRAADALQLSAALLAAEDRPETLPFVSMDDRLAQAAEREGFPIVRPDRV